MILTLLWTGWCALHSLLITDRAHAAAGRVVGRYAGIYRILYILVSVVTLLPVLWYHFTMPQRVAIEAGLFVRILQAILVVYGVLMLYLGARVYDMHYFLGVSQWEAAQKNREPRTLPFHTNGVLAWVRHPWYSGGIAFIWGVGNITDVYLVTRLILTVYFILGTLHEERRLVRELGPKYREYQGQVPMLVPRKPPENLRQ